MQRYYSTVNRSTRVFTWVITFLTIILVVAYSLIRPQETSLDLRGLIHCVFLGIICLVGFSLIQLYKSKNAWMILPINLFIMSLSVLYYFLVNFVIMKGINPLGKDTVEMNGDIAVSNFQTNNVNWSHEFNQGQTVLSCFRFCLVLIISCSTFTTLNILIPLITVIVICPFYIFNSLILLSIKFIDAGGSIQMFAFAGTFGFVLEVLLRYRNIENDNHTQLRKVRLTGIGYALMIVGGVIIWTLLPIIMETRIISKDFATNVIGPNPIAIIQMENMWGSLFSSLMGILIAESFEKVKVFRLQNVLYALICSSVTICTSAEFITIPFLATIIGLVCGFNYYTMFKYFDELSDPEKDKNPSGCGTELKDAIKKTFKIHGNCHFGFLLAGFVGSILAFVLSLIQMIDWLNPNWPNPNPMQIIRLPPQTAGIILAAIVITILVSMIAALIVFGLLILLYGRNPTLLTDRQNFLELNEDSVRIEKELSEYDYSEKELNEDSKISA